MEDSKSIKKAMVLIVSPYIFQKDTYATAGEPFAFQEVPGIVSFEMLSWNWAVPIPKLLLWQQSAA